MSKLDQHKLGEALRDRRHQLRTNLREVAKQTGVSASTLSRVENGKGYLLEIDTFLQICDWLDISPCAFLISDNALTMPELTTLQQVEWALRECPEMPELCRAVAEVLRLARLRE